MTNRSIIERAMDLGGKFEQRHESCSYCPNWWYSNHPGSNLSLTKEEAAIEYIKLVSLPQGN